MLKFSVCANEEVERNVRWTYVEFLRKGIFGNGSFVVAAEDEEHIRYVFQNGAAFTIRPYGYIVKSADGILWLWRLK